MKFLLIWNGKIVIFSELSGYGSPFMENYKLSSQQISSLKALYRTLKDRKEAYRVKLVISLTAGWSVSHVAEILLLDVNTVRSDTQVILKFLIVSYFWESFTIGNQPPFIFKATLVTNKTPPYIPDSIIDTRK
jgi:hypothetical protein